MASFVGVSLVASASSTTGVDRARAIGTLTQASASACAAAEMVIAHRVKKRERSSRADPRRGPSPHH